MNDLIKGVDLMVDCVLNSESNEETANILSKFINEWHNLKYDYEKAHRKDRNFGRKCVPLSFTEKIMQKVTSRMEDSIVEEIAVLFDDEKLVEAIIDELNPKEIAEGMMDEVYESLSSTAIDNGVEITFEDIEERIIDVITG